MAVAAVSDEPAAVVAGGPADRLLALAESFAREVTERIDQIVPFDGRLSALAAGTDTSGRVSVAVLDPATLREQSIVLNVGGKPRLRLFVKFNCCWDRGQDYLAVDASWFHVRLGDRDKDEPLFRYEYLRRPTKMIPAAHLQVHAHRDEFLYMLVAGGEGRPRVRQKTGEVPRLSVFHFPLGGHRFRPCLEDVLHALILEFGVDRRPAWRRAVEDGREQWRRLQLKAAVRDAPEDAAAVLADMGWKLEPPDVQPVGLSDRLRTF